MPNNDVAQWWKTMALQWTTVALHGGDNAWSVKEKENRHCPSPKRVREEEDGVEYLNDINEDEDGDLTERRWRLVATMV